MVIKAAALYVIDVAPLMMFAEVHVGAVVPAMAYHLYELYGTMPPEGLAVSFDVAPGLIEDGDAVGAPAMTTGTPHVRTTSPAHPLYT